MQLTSSCIKLCKLVFGTAKTNLVNLVLKNVVTIMFNAFLVAVYCTVHT